MVDAALVPDVADVAEGRGLHPRSLVVAIFGAFAAEADGWLASGSLVRLLKDLGVDAGPARSAISRLKRRGVLQSLALDVAPGYVLSPAARELIVTSTRRMFHPPAPEDAPWLLALFSIPEVERDKRHLLRSRLSALGFGTVTHGTWVAPAHVEAEARDTVERLGLTSYVTLFVAELRGFLASPDAVARWWDLPALRARYAEFLQVCQPLARRWRASGTEDEQAAFVDYVRTVALWRRLPYADPGIPAGLLPPDWPGTLARSLFHELHDALAEPALRHVRSVVS